MRRKFTNGFLDHAERHILEGSTLKEAAAILGCSYSNLSKALRARNPDFNTKINRGARCPNRNDALPENEIASRYMRGESCKALACAYGVARDVVSRILSKHGIRTRGRSTAMFVRANRMSPGERKALASAAHAKIKTLPESHFIASSIKRAKTIEARNGVINTGPGERELFDALVASGVDATWQKAISHYNIDITFGSVAVEVRSGHSGRMRSFGTHGRFKKIAECGLKLVSVQFIDQAAIEGSIEDVVALLHVLDRKPPAPGKYWVIRSGLQSSPITRFNGNKRPDVIAPPELVTSIRECDAG